MWSLVRHGCSLVVDTKTETICSGEKLSLCSTPVSSLIFMTCCTNTASTKFQGQMWYFFEKKKEQRSAEYLYTGVGLESHTFTFVQYIQAFCQPWWITFTALYIPFHLPCTEIFSYMIWILPSLWMTLSFTLINSHVMDTEVSGLLKENH